MSNEKVLATLVGRMKVEELARLAGMEVEALVAAVLGAGGPRMKGLRSSGSRTNGSHTNGALAGGGASALTESLARVALSSGHGATNGASVRTPAPAAPAASEAARVPFPELGDLVGRATYRQVHFAIDRWLLGNVWEEEGHNVSRAAARLEISRRRYRELFARTQGDDDGPVTEALEGRPQATVPAPALDSLLATGTYRTVHDEADRWLLAHVLEWTHGNLTHAARHLDVSRKHLREHLARVGMR